MGAGASRPRVEPSAESLAALPGPTSRNDCRLYSVIPEGELRRKGEVLLLEVGSQGFRLLKPGTEDPVYLYPWGQIHSWAHGACRFTFRYFDDGKHSIVHHTMAIRDVDELLEHIQEIIDNILTERKKSSISVEAFEELLQSLAAADPITQLDLIKQAAANSTFSSDQGRLVLEALPTAFDMVEAATVLHGKLIDQNRFSYMLEALDTQEDRDNVWHRITLMKKSQPLKRL